jgi:hypothetical protein
MSKMNLLSFDGPSSGGASKWRLKAGLGAVVCTVLLLYLQRPVLADHFPPSAIANGNAEHLLGGISIHGDTVASVITRMGSPDKFEESTSRDYPLGSGERSYEWNRDGIRLRMGTEFYTDKKAMTLVESPPIVVDVWGQHGGAKEGMTGRGLSIGDDLAKVKKLYGDHFQTDPHSMTIQWKDETTLSIDFSNDGHITHMQLFATQE